MEIKEIDSGLKIKSGIKEKMEIKIQNINENIPHRNGFIYALCGSGGSGKSSLLLSMFKSTKFYRKNMTTFISSVRKVHLCLLKNTPLKIIIKYIMNLTLKH